MVDLTNAADACDRLERATTLEELAREMSWPGYQAETDCFLAWAGDELVGFSDCFLRKGETNGTVQEENEAESFFYSWGLTHPAWRRKGVGWRLLERTYARALERVPETPPGPARFFAQTRDVEVGRCALYAGFGMEPVRYFINMARPVDDGLPPVQVPDGYRLRTFDAERDMEETWRVDMAAFADHWGFAPFPLDEYVHMLGQPGFRPGLSWLAEEEASGAVVGIGLNRISPDWIAQTGRQEGTVQVLGVLREHRQRGLGSALLVQSLHVLRGAGMQAVHLWADSENLTGAVRIYERLGFQVRKTTAVYRRALPNGARAG
jgi:mycothiol synthase